jgi:hypothetical protein
MGRTDFSKKSSRACCDRGSAAPADDRPSRQYPANRDRAGTQRCIAGPFVGWGRVGWALRRESQSSVIVHRQRVGVNDIFVDRAGDPASRSRTDPA